MLSDNYTCERQMSIMDFIGKKKKPFKITKPIRLLEFFAGIGSQSMALRDLGADFEPWVVCEFNPYAMKSYNAIHGTNFETSDIRDIKGGDLRITDKDKFCYVLTYSFP